MDKRDFLSILDLSRDEHLEILHNALALKKKRSLLSGGLKGKTAVLIFEKPSLRTRVTLETAIWELGGHPIVLNQEDIQLGKREAIKDIAKNLERWVAFLIARVFSHQTLVELADNTKIPVINALSDLEHPLQAVSDYLTIYESKKSFQINLAFIGDGNNVANSLLLLSATLGGNFTIASPPGYEIKSELVKRAQELAQTNGGKITLTDSPQYAVKNANFIYTDVWTSMGQEEEREKRRKIFANYQINAELLKVAPPTAKVLHCLPAHRGEEITDEVLDSPCSLVLEQAENRLHAAKALLLFLAR